MKKILFLMLLPFLMVTAVVAQPAAVQKAAKAVYRLTTFNANNDIIATCYAVALNAQGDCAAPWAPFVGAQRATIEDESGRTYNVESIYGANELYNVCHIHADARLAPITSGAKSVAAGTNVWASLPSRFGKAAEVKVTGAESFDKNYNYYQLSKPSAGNSPLTGAALMNNSGQAVGIIQTSASGELAAIDLDFVRTLKIENALAANDPTLRTTGIRIALPTDKEQALALLMLVGQRTDSLTRVDYIHDFIRQFPNEVDGYQALAEEELRGMHFSLANQQITTALQKATNKAEAHAALAKLIYQKASWFPQVEFPEWSLEKGLEAIRAAQKLHPQPVYAHQEAQLLYMQGDYNNALQGFLALTKTPLRSGEIFFEASACKEALQAPTTEIIELLDSAVQININSEPLLSAPYVLSRADVWNRAKDYRKAVIDYNLYDSIMGGRPISTEFYYVRSQCEMQIRQYQQALNDLNRALLLSRTNPLLWAEKAALHLRFKQYEDAIRASEICMKLDPQNTDAMIIKGKSLLSQSAEKGRAKQEAADKRQEALTIFAKAKALGDDRGDEMMK